MSPALLLHEAILILHVCYIAGSLAPQHTYPTASTGVAACHIGGTTLHQFAGTKGGNYFGDKENVVTKFSVVDCSACNCFCQHYCRLLQIFYEIRLWFCIMNDRFHFFFHLYKVPVKSTFPIEEKLENSQLPSEQLPPGRKVGSFSFQKCIICKWTFKISAETDHLQAKRHVKEY